MTEQKSLMLYRRDVMKMGLGAFVASVVPLVSARVALAAGENGVRHISFRHAHTGETFSGVYRVGDKYLPEAFERLNYVMRDFRTNQIFPMDPQVVDILSGIQSRTKTGKPMDVLSGYRSPKTNSMLRHDTSASGVAKNSFHMYGQAIDFRMPGYNTGKLRKLACGLKAGGVGYYPRSNFVHVDTGTIRTW